MNKKVLIISGGTGGHIFPGIAVGDALIAEGYGVTWLGSETGMEKELVATRFDFYSIPVYQLRRKGMQAWLLLPMRLCHAIWQALALFKKIKPDVVIAFGGFVAGPGSLAAKLLGIPLIIHEQNARAGLTNRYLAKIATVTLQAFPHAFKPSVAAKTVGNPVRESIQSLPLPAERLFSHEGPLRLLILGGSLGASALNTAIIHWLSQLSRCSELVVKHQTGKANSDKVQAAYAKQGLPVEVLPFIDDMASIWEWTDVVICRAGAITVSEVAAVGVAAIFVPMPHAVDNHQFYNADYLAKSGAAIVIEQDRLSPEWLSQVITPLLDNRHAILTMSNAARALSKPMATVDIVSVLERFCPHP